MKNPTPDKEREPQGWEELAESTVRAVKNAYSDADAVKMVLTNFDYLLASSRSRLIEEVEKIVIDPENEHTPYYQLGAARMKHTVLATLRKDK